MNRIILIGNGFDLAHGMKTHYKDFLEDYWSGVIEALKTHASGKSFNYGVKIENCPAQILRNIKDFNDLISTLKSYEINFSFENKYLEKISTKNNIDNWVDAENEYYELLRSAYINRDNSKFNYDIEKLNKDFNEVKELLQEYLSSVYNHFEKGFDLSNPMRSEIHNKLYENFNYNMFSESAKDEKVEEIYVPLKSEINSVRINGSNLSRYSGKKYNLMSALRISSDPEKTIRELLLSDNSKDYFDLIPNRTLLLNFNYTQTDRFYQDYWTGKSRKAEIIHIHGSTAPEDKNPIIFGFGDELDDDYQNIEKLNDDRFLENIKSIDYLQTNNYKNLLEFIDGERYQIFICGHSCGLSDRTLLNTLFEHENCSSIRSFFYMPNESDDNFKQITCNISRNFNDKAKLRDRVVNKMYSEELVRRK